MATTITPKGSSGVTNIPATSNTQAAISGPTIPEDGTAWGAEVAHDTQGDSSFDFDGYAQSTATQMQALGYTSTATAQYVSAMYAGYLASGGGATAQATGQLGASSNLEAGIYGQQVTGALGLPGQGQEPPIGGTGGMSLSPSTAAMIGTNLASNSNVNYGQWRANMEADLTGAGYSQNQVTQFMGQVDTAFYKAQPNNIVNSGVAKGQSSGISNSTDLETYISKTVVPSLQQQGLNADQINQYVEGLRAGVYSGGNSAVVNSGLQQGQEVASFESATSSFNFDAYAQSVATVIASPSSGLNTAQQQSYIDAMYAGYLRGGGVATQEASTVSQISSTAGATSGAANAGSTGGGARATSTQAGTGNVTVNSAISSGIQRGQSLTNISSTTQLESYISNTVVPELQKQGATPNQINQYVEGLRAGVLSEGKGSVVTSGLQQGQQVASAQSGNSSFNFDSYAQSVASTLASSSSGLDAAQQQGYLSAMYAGYLGAGGAATQEAGTISALPGTSGATNLGGSSATSSASGANLGLLASGNSSGTSSASGANLGSLASGSSSGTSSASGANLGSLASGTAGATSGASASMNSIVSQGVQFGRSLQSFSSSTDLENYVSSTLVPSLQKQNLSPNQINQYVEGMRAGIYSEGNSSVVSAGLQQGQQTAAAQAGTSSFSFDNYAQSVASTLASPSSGLDAAQQASYLSAMYAGYLGAGGVATQEATTVSQTSTTGGGSSGTGTSSGTGSSSGTGTSSGAGASPSVGATPAWATQIYSLFAASPSAGALSSDAANVQSAVTALSSAAALELQNPTSTHAANLQLQWQRARSAEGQFWSDYTASSGTVSPSIAAIAQKFQTDASYTLEGEMPSSYGPGTLPSATSSAAFVSLEALAASSALGSGVSLPSNLGQIIDNPSAMSSMSQGDFASTAEGLVALYQQSPATYYAAIQSFRDPALKSALNYAVQDMVTNNASSLVQNKASVAQENTALGQYFKQAQANPSTYVAWLPQPTSVSSATSGATAASTGLSAIPPSTADYANLTAFLTSNKFDGNSPAKFAEACTMMANLWQTNQSAYYQVLGAIPDQNLRNAVNAGVQTEITNNPQNLTNNRGTADFENIWNQSFSKTGPGASAPTASSTHLNVSTQTGG